MVKVKVNKGDVSVSLEGSTTDIAAEVGLAVYSILKEIHNDGDRILESKILTALLMAAKKYKEDTNKEEEN